MNAFHVPALNIKITKLQEKVKPCIDSWFGLLRVNRSFKFGDLDDRGSEIECIDFILRILFLSEFSV